MADLVIFCLLFAAIAIGWVLGRRSAFSPRRPDSYFAPDRRAREAPAKLLAEAVAEELAVGGGNTQTRMALGAQLRRRGEVDGAVQVHQDLIARPSLPADEVALARLELARDYISAGLLDRAEELLLDLVRDFPRQRQAARRHLLEVYETERDWPRAVEVAEAMLAAPQDKSRRGSRRPEESPGNGQPAAVLLAHYCCELAEEASRGAAHESARGWLQRALDSDGQCVRASILLGRLEFDCGQYGSAIRALQQVPAQDADYLAETIDLLRECHAALGETVALPDFLAECLRVRPSAALIAAVADDIIRAEGEEAAAGFLAAKLRQHPSLRGLDQLIGLLQRSSEGRARDDLDLLQSLSRQLVAMQAGYRCGHCGFAGKYLHWQCPGCKHWGSIKPVEGSIGYPAPKPS